MIVDPARDAAEALMAMQESLLHRMLSAWEERWGLPVAVYRPSKPKPYYENSHTLYSELYGLAIEDVKVGSRVSIMVCAADHIDADGNVKPMTMERHCRAYRIIKLMEQSILKMVGNDAPYA